MYTPLQAEWLWVEATFQKCLIYIQTWGCAGWTLAGDVHIMGMGRIEACSIKVGAMYNVMKNLLSGSLYLYVYVPTYLIRTYR